jgi:hypothetical protein
MMQLLGRGTASHVIAVAPSLSMTSQDGTLHPVIWPGLGIRANMPCKRARDSCLRGFVL